MSETESTLPPNALTSDVSERLGRIQEIADAVAPEVEVPDNRALEGEDALLIAGESWLRQEIIHTKHLHYVRLSLLGSLFVLVVLWLISVGVLLLVNGFGSLLSFHLSDKVIMTYIGSTTVSVLGLFHIAAKWLFSAGFADFAKSFSEMHRNSLTRGVSSDHQPNIPSAP